MMGALLSSCAGQDSLSEVLRVACFNFLFRGPFEQSVRLLRKAHSRVLVAGVSPEVIASRSPRQNHRRDENERVRGSFNLLCGPYGPVVTEEKAFLSLSFRLGDGGPRVKTITTKRASKCAVPPIFLDETPFSFFRRCMITAITPRE